jgi:uncharacterized protein YndB with AHSA1/START domain
MKKNLKVEDQIEIDASAEKIWDALINPEKIKQYLYGTEAISEWKAGSPIIFQGTWEGKPYQDKGFIMDFVPNKLFRYEYWSGFSGKEGKKENYSEVTFEISSQHNSFVLKLKQQGFANEQAHAHSLQGWKAVLEKIKEVVEHSV